jgi:hypothetical protein
LIAPADNDRLMPMTIENFIAPGGSVKTGGLGDGSSADNQAIAKLRLMLPLGAHATLRRIQSEVV